MGVKIARRGRAVDSLGILTAAGLGYVRRENTFVRLEEALLAVVARGEFLLNGFRNRDLQAHLFAGAAPDPQTARRRSGAVTRNLHLLRAHRLIREVPGTHRYLLTLQGQKIITALLAAQAADTAKLTDAA